jgi:predicted nucleic acid-binding protein
LPSTAYVDTSVLGRVLLGESDGGAIRRDLQRFERRIASRLLGVELRRVGRREGALEDAERLLENVVLLPIDERTLTAAEAVPPSTVGTLDAIHLATALRLAAADELDALMTYDKQLANAAREHGIEVISPS